MLEERADALEILEALGPHAGLRLGREEARRHDPLPQRPERVGKPHQPAQVRAARGIAHGRCELGLGKALGEIQQAGADLVDLGLAIAQGRDAAPWVQLRELAAVESDRTA